MDLANLIEDCKRKRTSAQKCLYDRYATAMFLLCRRYVKTNEEAEELVLNGFLKFFQGIAKFVFVNEPSATAWIKRIMVNECLMHLRKRNSFLQATDELPEAIVIDETALDKLGAEEIFTLITKLPIGYRTVFNLFALEGYTHKEIAGALSITEGTSKSQYSKARVMLQHLIAQNNNHYATANAR